MGYGYKTTIKKLNSGKSSGCYGRKKGNKTHNVICCTTI